MSADADWDSLVARADLERRAQKWREGIVDAIMAMPVPPGVPHTSVSAVIGFDDTLMLVNWDDLEDEDADLDTLRPGDPGVLAFFEFETMYGAVFPS